MKIIRKIILLATAALAIVVSTGCTRIEAGYVGVKVDKFGDERGVSIETVGPGTHWAGWNVDYYKFPTFTQNKVWDSEGNNEEFTFQTKEGMSIRTDLGISYFITKEDASAVFQKYRKGVDEITSITLRALVRDALNMAGSTVAVEDAYGPGKAALQTKVESDVKRQAEAVGITVEKVYFVNQMRLPDAVNTSINAKLAATQQAQQKENELRSAIADAEKTKAKAEGDKQAVILRAQGEAEAMEITGNALRKNPGVAELKAIEKWDGKLPTTMLPNGSTPFINVK